ncbi:MAG: T9SS type A sorting domain-containing protein [Ignavibacteria bacterium]|nr:T9SS type A sorting domain-containing protein [Ignavibacteria bacterium]
MRKSIVLFLLLQLITSYSYAQSGWVLQNSSFGIGTMRGISFPSYDTGYICGDSGRIIKTTNSSANWFIVNTNTRLHLWDVHFVNNTTGFAGGINQKFIKTTNGGTSWDSITISPFSTTLINCLYFLNKDTGYISLKSGLYGTSNGGMNWSYLISALSSFTYIEGLQFLNNQIGFCFQSYTVPNGPSYTGVFKTTNSGFNWIQISFFGARFNGLHMINENIGFGIANMGIQTYKTTNGGYTWVSIFNKAATTIYFTNINTGYFAGYKTTNSGENWWIQNIDITDRANILDIKFINNNTGIMVGGTWGIIPANGLIYKTTDGGGTLIPVSITTQSQETPEIFNLKQNYPNPFNPQTKIKFDIPANVRGQTSNVKLIIYDLLGREVTSLVDEELKPGTYEADWDGSNYSSGVYFYKLISNDFVETKKMVLMK